LQFTTLQLFLISTFIQLFTVILLLNRSSRIQKRAAWPRADYLINKPRSKRIGELFKSWTRVGFKRITLQFLGSPGVDRMFVLTLAGPSLVYVRRTAAQLNPNNELRLKWGSLLGFCGKAE